MRKELNSTIENYKDKSVERIIIGSDVTLIKTHAFKDCIYLKEVYFADRDNPLRLEPNAFPESGIERIRFSNNIRTELDNEINLCNVKTVSVSKFCEIIPYNSFFYEDDEKRAFESKFEELIIEKGNKRWDSEDGVWYSDDQITLYPHAKKDKIFEIRNGTTIAAYKTFVYNKYIERLIIPASFELEKTNIFISNCPNLKTIEIQGNNKEIGTFFEECDNLSYIITDKTNHINFETDDLVVFSSKEEMFEKVTNFKDLNNFYKEFER